MRTASASIYLFIAILVLLLGRNLLCVSLSAPPVCPEKSPATGLKNRFYSWKENQQIRYQSCGPQDGEPVVLVHGLFLNSDYWRKTLKALSDEGYRAYALDLWGCGWSDRPSSKSPAAQRCNGESGRFPDARSTVLWSAQLGTAGGVLKRVCNIQLTHPLGSPYNFYTWSDLVKDFCRDIVLKGDHGHTSATLVANSIGCVTAHQALLDAPYLYKGVFDISPNFRELHSAEVPFAFLNEILENNQGILREYGRVFYDILATPLAVKLILKCWPYANKTAVDDTLVKVLLDPLLADAARDVVFDTLSYNAGPLPEPQLAMFPKNKPVWICYGKADPWSKGKRMEALIEFDCVEKIVSWKNVGHCPHDEAPERVHPLLFDFLKRLRGKGNETAVSQRT